MVIHFFFPLPLSISDSDLFLNCRPGESVVQKLTDELKSLFGSCEASYAPNESMNHPFPHIKASIDSRYDRVLNETDGIIKQDLVVADMYADWG
jgi:hypothetical protein